MFSSSYFKCGVLIISVYYHLELATWFCAMSQVACHGRDAKEGRIGFGLDGFSIRHKFK